MLPQRRASRVDEIVGARRPTASLISPGPGAPRTPGISQRGHRALRPAQCPVLGVCLGHQCIGQVFGGDVVRAAEIMHGKTSLVHHDGDGRASPGCPTRSRPPATTRWWSTGTRCPTCSRSPPRPTTARSWACATASCRSRACSSTPSRSSPSVGHDLLANFLAPRRSRACAVGGRASRPTRTSWRRTAVLPRRSVTVVLVVDLVPPRRRRSCDACRPGRRRWRRRRCHVDVEPASPRSARRCRSVVPITSGTVTCCGPRRHEDRHREPLSTAVPAGGSVRMTLPRRLWSTPPGSPW